MGLLSWFRNKNSAPKKYKKDPFEEGLYTFFTSFIKQCCIVDNKEYIPFTVFISAFANYLRYMDSITTNTKYCYITYAHNHTYSLLKRYKKEYNIDWSLSPGFVSYEGVDTRVLMGITVTHFIM